MATDRRSLSPGPDADLAGQQSRLDSELIRPRLQLDRDPEHDSSSLHTSPLPTHPFNFPTLNVDGSLPDITAHQSARSYPPTPPAALSSLGAKVNMLQRDEPGEGSFADNQYDMIDDLSEISNDDHDTASITSNGEDGQLTPDETLSQAELDDAPSSYEEELRPHQGPITDSFVELPLQLPTSPSQGSSIRRLPRKVQADNALLDSYMSEDLDTPRQSTIATASSKRPARKASHILETDPDITRILLVAGKDVPRRATDPICSRVASCLTPHAQGKPASAKVVRLPLTPSGILPPSATVVDKDGDPTAAVQHCIDAMSRSSSSSSKRPAYQLRILDCDETYSTWLTIGDNGKIDLQVPGFAIVYVDPKATDRDWLSCASAALQEMEVPVLVVYQDALSDGLPPLRSLMSEKNKMVQTMSAESLLAMDNDTLTASLRRFPGLLPEEPTIRSDKKSWQLSTVMKFGGAKLLLTSCMITLILSSILTLLLKPAVRPMVDVQSRREALRLAATRSLPPEIASKYNFTSLIPAPSPPYRVIGTSGFWAAKEDRSATRNVQMILPNHFAVSLAAMTQLPTVVTTKVSSDDGRAIPFNVTELIEGVYHISFDAEDACGKLVMNIFTRSPETNLTINYDTGHDCKRVTSTDLSEIVSKEVALMRGAAKSLTSKLTTEIGASVSATKNVTTQLALYVMSDWDSRSKAGRAMLDKLVKESNETASTVTKDLVLMSRDLVKYCKDLSTTATSSFVVAKSHSKAMIRAPLQLSRDRLDSLRQAFKRKKASLRERTDKADRVAPSDVPWAGKPAKTFQGNAPEEASRLKREYSKAKHEHHAMQKRLHKHFQDSAKTTARREIDQLTKGILKKERELKKMRAKMLNGAPFA